MPTHDHTHNRRNKTKRCVMCLCVCVCVLSLAFQCHCIRSCLLSCAMRLLLLQYAVRHMLARQQPGKVVLVSTAAPCCSNQTAVCCCCRQAWRAVCRQTWLAKHGKLVIIPQHQRSRSSVAGLAAHLQQELEAVAGGSLVPYHC